MTPFYVNKVFTGHYEYLLDKYNSEDAIELASILQSSESPILQRIRLELESELMTVADYT
jgi:hypothetical protein